MVCMTSVMSCDTGACVLGSRDDFFNLFVHPEFSLDAKPEPVKTQDVGGCFSSFIFFFNDFFKTYFTFQNNSGLKLSPILLLFMMVGVERCS